MLRNFQGLYSDIFSSHCGQLNNSEYTTNKVNHSMLRPHHHHKVRLDQKCSKSTATLGDLMPKLGLKFFFKNPKFLARDFNTATTSQTAWNRNVFYVITQPFRITQIWVVFDGSDKLSSTLKKFWNSLHKKLREFWSFKWSFKLQHTTWKFYLTIDLFYRVV